MVVIGDEFQATQQASWLGTSYLMSLALCSPIYGRLSGSVSAVTVNIELTVPLCVLTASLAGASLSCLR